MRLPLRPRSLLPLIALLATGLRADEVQQLPDMVVERPVTRDVQVSLVELAPTAEPAAGLAALALRTAGLSVSDAGARGFGAITTLRGLGNTPYFSDSSVPVYLDDIPLATGFTFPTDLYDFSSVAVHRGPQAATLFGRAGDAGVIHFTSARPAAGTRSRATFSAGNHGLLAASASVQSAPSADTEISAGLSASQRDGYVRNTQLNQDVDDRESVSARLKLTHRPVAGTELSFHVLGQRARDGAQALVPLGGPYHEVQRGQEGVADTDFAAAALGFSRDLDAGTLSTTTSWSNWEMNPYSNRLVVFGGADFDSVVTQSQRTFSEEIRFAGPRGSGGAFWSTSRTRGSADRVFSGFPIEQSRYTTDADTFALFGRANFTPAPGWTLTPGLRAEQTDKDFTRIETIPGSAVIRRDDDWSAFLPSLAATRKIDDATDLTLSLARGFKAGGYSGFTGHADLAAFGAQRAWTAEAAYRTTFKESHLATTARAYASRVTGYQIERSFAVPGSFADEYLVVNAGEARVLGLELESSWNPAADWTVTLVGSISHAELEEFTDPFTGATYSGNRAPYAPSGNGALRVDYRPATGFFAGAGLSWTGTTYYDEQETAFLAQRSYTLVEADAGYAFAAGEVRLFGRNLGDEEYYSSITPGVGHGTPGAPLTWGVELSVSW
ncbi:ferrichrome outer membrane transporter [Lacunisphaera limnophila]|uniref:Ferrichrome outer membrane transporter n=1 Tax=Lacunisphaera limnophila TaxID=1838286 RepID=A0A1I7PHF9_9BACT|nr:TonB-dependent receptor [Lacunisphaera limnophila]AOS43039.1 ferrichrome outer membrane transporter [Lacunisphaera limnophila]